MKDNKLIAEFMGMTPHEQDGGCMIQMTHQGNEVVLVSSMKYHSSWDWLIPVLKKIKLQLHPHRAGLWWMLTDPVKYDIKDVHGQAVQFINESNKMDT